MIDICCRTTHITHDKQGCVRDLGVDKEVDSRVEDNDANPNQIVEVGACEPYQPVGEEGYIHIFSCC